MFGYLARTPQFVPPVAGSKALAFGNSISDPTVTLGQWFRILCDRYQWIPVAHGNHISNSDFEVDVSNWTTTVGTLTRDTTMHANSGLASGKLAISTGAAAFTSPYNPAATTQGSDTQGDAGGMRCGMRGGQYYVFSAYVSCAAPNAANTSFIGIYTNSGAGATLRAYAYMPVGAGFTRISCAYTIESNATEAFLRVINGETTNGRFINFDQAQLECFAAPPTGFTAPTVWTDYTKRGAIAGANLQNNDATPNNGQDNRAARLDAYAPDIVFIMYSENDLYYTSAAGAVTPTTLARWEASLSAVLTAVLALTPVPKIVLLGCSRTTYPFTGGALPFGVDVDDAVAQMDAVTHRQARNAGALFVPIRSRMTDDLVQTPANVNGKHPVIPDGHRQIAAMVQAALDGGTP